VKEDRDLRSDKKLLVRYNWIDLFIIIFCLISIFVYCYT
jgi:hypothetical protein